ncbi:family 4 glycosyl hydrolase [Paractinoplanes brasiliensis]|uniref:6-phospho-beta-glucosidase n=1 Tax=Paractinoplanes brasiliensis TaxID=52695 RepID=A0A4R6J6H4_9ACTN|nr:6-phospho-beta-glucosidase [Actinoplanes brasiliensis]TDO31069.1 6-phospho-beta-glucosidase [Actinoplanes brasiliensis]
MSRRKLVILGGGGFRVPLVYGALRGPGSPVDEVVLHDVDATRLSAVVRVLRGFGGGPRIEATTDLTEALTGASFVFSAIRVHGLEGRVIDERVALGEGMLGQETVGAGGIAYGLRTVPVARAIARRISLVAPGAWVINFTNPAGLVTEAMAAHLGDRVIGICDSPSALVRRVLRALDVAPSEVEIEYAGLNHLGWLTAVRGNGVDLLPRLLASPSLVESFEEGQLFGAERLRALGAVPNEYLHYYYDHAAVVRDLLAAPETRGEFLLRRQRDVYARLLTAGGTALEAWQEARRERDATYMATEGLGTRDAESVEGGGYEGVALALMSAIATGTPTPLILNVRNRGTLPALDDEAVVEVPCVVDGSGARPLPTSLFAGGADLVRRIKATDRAVLEAAVTGSRAVAVRAMASHPLIDSVPVARRLIAGYQEALPELRYLS